MFDEPIRRRGLFSLTPLIDVVFQLLIFFMLSTTFMHSQTLTVSTPSQSAGALPQDANVVEIWLMADGSTRVAEKPVTADSLNEAVKTALGGRTDLTVSILAEKGSRTQAFVSAVEAARLAGARNVATARIEKFTP
ncbi:MAG: biopolymer transporter ExbD [Parvibaculum sp.]|uniref:ExbD/TolR family protein n=1 Tax=Parvibaculum sp. TaxID=2024848 RepID=UPI003C75C5AE